MSYWPSAWGPECGCYVYLNISCLAFYLFFPHGHWTHVTGINKVQALMLYPVAKINQMMWQAEIIIHILRSFLTFVCKQLNLNNNEKVTICGCSTQTRSCQKTVTSLWIYPLCRYDIFLTTARCWAESHPFYSSHKVQSLTFKKYNHILPFLQDPIMKSFPVSTQATPHLSWLRGTTLPKYLRFICLNSRHPGRRNFRVGC